MRYLRHVANQYMDDDMRRKRQPGWTDRKLLFAEHYLECGQGKMAALKAGYSETHAASTASRLLLHDPNVREFVQRRRENNLHRSTAERRLMEVRTIALEQDDTLAAAICDLALCRLITPEPRIF